MIEEIRELFQNFIAPQLEGIRGDIRALAADVHAVDVKVESCRRELLSEIRRVEEVLSTDFVRLEQKADLRLAAMNEKLDLFRPGIPLHSVAHSLELKAHSRAG